MEVDGKWCFDKEWAKCLLKRQCDKITFYENGSTGTSFEQCHYFESMFFSFYLLKAQFTPPKKVKKFFHQLVVPIVHLDCFSVSYSAKALTHFSTNNMCNWTTAMALTRNHNQVGWENPQTLSAVWYRTYLFLSGNKPNITVLLAKCYVFEPANFGNKLTHLIFFRIFWHFKDQIGDWLIKRIIDRLIKDTYLLQPYWTSNINDSTYWKWRFWN